MDTLLTSYETIYIIKPNLSEDNLLKVIENYQGLLIERGAKNIVTQNRGRRGLKYLINKFRDGVYIQMNYEANGDVVEFIEKSMRINEDLIRFLTTRSIS
jgi:small subunit ribosomal protein S6